ncbi:serine hydrolase domain-containing protein [Neobacillus niacini]|uniref:serine hydrolase domain-containing protein n=1 Tax=Neobacillus niacini TaxID=86668 RepID=UPI00285D90AD|nr:serine hydrolase domain-containing protein [Neobacillus niacini]MDR6999523.1 CubicO group peptidase (beta-lactamase class C family) [Neobacillus niacini]
MGKNLLICLFIILMILGQTACQSMIGIHNHDHQTLAKQHEAKLKEIVQKGKTTQQRISDYLRYKHINGSVAVLKNHKLVYNKGIGYANFKAHILNQPYTSYPIGSITKAFVATSIIQLQEKGMLSIEDPLSKYIPDFPNGREIKLVHLLSHTSGIQKPLWQIWDTRPVDIINEAAKRPLLFYPGTEWDYKDINYLILGYILEKVSGTTLNEYIQKNIFVPAGMKNSGFITEENPFPSTSTGYLKISRHLHPIKKLNPYPLFSCGDIYTTALDLSRFDEALFGGKLISRTSLKEMLRPRSISKYGFGLYHYPDSIFSRGVLLGWESFHVYYKDKTQITILLNIHSKKTKIKAIANDIHTIIKLGKSHHLGM